MADKGRIVAAAADWRDEQQYLHLLDLDRAGWAWEWLRRNPDYIEGEAADAAPASWEGQGGPTILNGMSAVGAPRWGLCFCRGADAPG
jgi:hypothetical protein